MPRIAGSFRRLQAPLVVAIAFCCVCLPARSQSLNSLLNAVDQPQNWTPQNSTIAAPQPIPSPQQFYAQPNVGYGQPAPMYQQPNLGYGQPAPMYQQPNIGYMQQPGPMYQQPNIGYAPYNQSMMQTAPAASPLRFGNIFRTILGGQPAAPPIPQAPKSPLAYFLQSGPPDEQAAIAQVQENLNTATNQEEQAINDANSVSGQSDSGAQQSLASSAQYHANAARAASDQAYSTACNSHSATANDLAAQARAMADRAQSAAARARSNCKSGW